jgi:hypothetical protein
MRIADLITLLECYESCLLQVFELILRLKGNYLWPAMWGRAFYDDDSLNAALADEYGIVPEYSSMLVPATILATTTFMIINRKRLNFTRSRET